LMQTAPGRADFYRRKLMESNAVPIGRLRCSSSRGTQPRKTTGAKRQVPKALLDVDEVLRRFTPRLRDISQEQAEAYECRGTTPRPGSSQGVPRNAVLVV